MEAVLVCLACIGVGALVADANHKLTEYKNVRICDDGNCNCNIIHAAHEDFHSSTAEALYKRKRGEARSYLEFAVEHKMKR